MTSFGMLSTRAFSAQSRSFALPSRLPPPWRAATVIMRASFAKALARLASTRSLRNLMFEEWEWPAMARERRRHQSRRRRSRSGRCLAARAADHSALAELRRTACLVAAVLLAFDLARVARQEAVFTQHLVEVRVFAQQRAGHT